MTDELNLDELPDTLSTVEAAAATRFEITTIRRAIRRGELQATRPRGRDPRRFGRHGYRITRAALKAWYFGKEDPS